MYQRNQPIFLIRVSPESPSMHVTSMTIHIHNSDNMEQPCSLFKNFREGITESTNNILAIDFECQAGIYIVVLEFY